MPDAGLLDFRMGCKELGVLLAECCGVEADPADAALVDIVLMIYVLPDWRSWDG
jgi:hypothetical protein